MLCEMQSVSSRICTRVAVSISYDDNHYTTGTSCFVVIAFIDLYLPMSAGEVESGKIFIALSDFVE